MKKTSICLLSLSALACASDSFKEDNGTWYGRYIYNEIEVRHFKNCISVGALCTDKTIHINLFSLYPIHLTLQMSQAEFETALAQSGLIFTKVK